MQEWQVLPHDKINAIKGSPQKNDTSTLLRNAPVGAVSQEADTYTN